MARKIASVNFFFTDEYDDLYKPENLVSTVSMFLALFEQFSKIIFTQQLHLKTFVTVVEGFVVKVQPKHRC